MKRLGTLLQEFDGRNKIEVELTKEFKEIAKAALYGGHFVVTNDKESFELRLREVEFYFHSENLEESTITNTAMYHFGKDVDYFPIGSLHPHNSGVDITFEKEDCYRASFLVREYEYKDKKGNWVTEDRPRYFCEDLFGYTGGILGNGPKITWVDDDVDKNAIEVDNEPRIRVSMHDENGNVVKDKDGKTVYNKRPWKFKRKTERKG